MQCWTLRQVSRRVGSGAAMETPTVFLIMCVARIKGLHCCNEKQMFVWNSPHCSSFSLFFPSSVLLFFSLILRSACHLALFFSSVLSPFLLSQPLFPRLIFSLIQLLSLFPSLSPSFFCLTLFCVPCSLSPSLPLSLSLSLSQLAVSP